MSYANLLACPASKRPFSVKPDGNQNP